MIYSLLRKMFFSPTPAQLSTVREELVPRMEDECVNEKPLAEEGGKKRKKVLDISILD